MTETPLTALAHRIGQGSAEGHEISMQRIPVLVTELPNSMPKFLAETLCANPNFSLLSAGLTSNGYGGTETNVGGKRIYLTAEIPYHSLIYHPGTIAVDFADSGLGNALRLIEANIPFVAINSEGSMEELRRAVTRSKICAVAIADTDDLSLNCAIAIEFLAEQMRNGLRGQVFTTADFLRGGEA